jgi:hypothetical protein
MAEHCPTALLIILIGNYVCVLLPWRFISLSVGASCGPVHCLCLVAGWCNDNCPLIILIDNYICVLLLWRSVPLSAGNVLQPSPLQSRRMQEVLGSHFGEPAYYSCPYSNSVFFGLWYVWWSAGDMPADGNDCLIWSLSIFPCRFVLGMDESRLAVSWFFCNCCRMMSRRLAIGTLGGMQEHLSNFSDATFAAELYRQTFLSDSVGLWCLSVVRNSERQEMPLCS